MIPSNRPQANDDGQAQASWCDSLRAFLHPQVATMLFLGFAAGIPILLIFSSLSLWLGEAGIERRAVTFFSWAALGYSFKFVWAPLIDVLPLPLLTRRLGRRRAWLLLAQLAIVGAIVLMAMIDPAQGQDSLVRMALAAALLGFSSATQDIVIDAYRIEAGEPRLQALMSSSYIAGYRVGMIVAGAGALYLAELLGSSKGAYLYDAWRVTYLLMAACMLVGILTTLRIAEPPARPIPRHRHSGRDYLRLVLLFAAAAAAFVLTFFHSGNALADLRSALGGGELAGFAVEALHLLLAIVAAALVGRLLVALGLVDRAIAHHTWIAPIRDFFARYGARTAWLLLALIGLYRISDIVLGVISNVFYQDLGFTKPEIAAAVKTFGVVVSIAGGFVGGLLATRMPVLRVLMLGALLSALTNLVFVTLAQAGHSLPMLYFAVAADNLAGGLASAAFVAFLSSLTNVSFTAVQYAIFSSLMTLLPKLLGGYSGSIVDGIGYSGFFVFTTLIGLPVLGLVWLVSRRLAQN